MEPINSTRQSARIRESRERAGWSQEALAERLGVSRQSVSKWETGAAVPTPENLRALAEVLDMDAIQAPPAGNTSGSPKTPKHNIWKGISLFSIFLCLLLLFLWARREAPSAVSAVEPAESELPQYEAPVITDVTFFDMDGTPLRVDTGDGWLTFQTGAQVLMAVSFQDTLDASVHGVSLYLTPTGTGTYDLREQLAVRAVGEGDGLALFPLEITPETTGHLEVVLECDGGQTYSTLLNVCNLA